MSFIKCLGELKEFNDDGVPIQEQEYCSTMKLPDGSTTKDLLDALFKKAKREPTDFKCNRTLVYDSDFDAYEDYSEDVLVDKGRYRFHLSRKYEGMKDDEVREFFDVPRRQRDDDAASGISDVTRISHFTRDSLANNQWNYQPNQNPAQPPIWNQVYNQDTPPNLPHDYMQNNPPYSPHVYSQMNSPNPPHINNQTPPPTPPTQKLRRDDDTGSSDTLASGHHSIKSGVENLKVNDDKKNNEPKNKYYKGGVRKPAQTKTDTTKIVEYKTITRRSLGLDGVHGDVFDAHRDNFSDINIFNDNLEQIDSSAIEVTRVDDLRTPIIEANVFSDKIDLLHMENDLTVSTIARLNNPSGHGLFVTEYPKSEREITTSFAYIIKTEIHELDLAQVHSLIATNIFNTPNITHFISAIEFGYIVAITVRAKLTRETKVEKVIDEMKNYFNSVKKNLGGKQDNENQTKFSCKIHYDNEYKIPFRNGSKTPFELASLIQNMINSAGQKTESRGTKIGYHLKPLHELKKYIQHLNLVTINIIPFPDDYFNMLIKKHETVIKCLAKMNDLKRDIKNFSTLLNDDVIKSAEKSIKDIKDEHNSVLEALGMFVTSYRSKTSCAYTWEKINEKYDAFIQRINHFIDEEWKPFYAKIENFYRWTKHENFIHIGKNEKFEDKMGNLDEFYVFFCKWSEIDTTDDGELKKFEQLLAEKKPCIFVDQDVTEGKFPDECRLCHYKDGKAVDEDLLSRYVKKFVVSVANSGAKSGDQRPNDAVQLEMCCPKSLKDQGCGKDLHFWFCKNCSDCYYYYKEFFYCSCGKANAYTFEFRCNDPAHGQEFVKFERSALEKLLKDIKPMVDMNILVLGQTGVGKSTWLNALANYLCYSSLQQAIDSPKDVFLISSKYMIKDHMIEVGEASKEERIQVGKSATKAAGGYMFVTRNLRIHLIDTPGMADTDGTNEDKENMETILRYLSGYNEVHAVCILLKPNESRATSIWKYCINELLVSLHKDVVKNIIFCFTNAKGNFFAGGDTLSVLQEHFSNMKSGVKLEAKKDNIYYMDNEAIRYLYALKRGVEFDEIEVESIKMSWETSQKEIARMIKYVKNLKPHRMQDMISLNNVRRAIMLLAKPMADISRNIETNIHALNEKKSALNLLSGNEKDLKEKLQIPQYDIETEPLGYPRTVCTAAKCITTQSVGNSDVVQNLYTTHCHPHCYLNGITPNSFPDPQLLGCAAMSGENCRGCGCSYKVHMHITYGQKLVKNSITDPSVTSILAQKNNNKAAIQATIQAIEENIRQYKVEQRTITDISCIFGVFLRHNSIMPYNDAYEDYVKHNITEETNLASEPGLTPEVRASRQAKLVALHKSLAEYNEQKKIIMEAQGTTSANLDKDEIQAQISKLFALPKTGANIKHIFEQASSGQEKELKFMEKTFAPEQHDFEQFNTAKLQSKDSVFAELTPAPEKLSKTISMDPPKKRENIGFTGWLVDKWYWFTGRSETKNDDMEDDLEDNMEAENEFEHVSGQEDGKDLPQGNANYNYHPGSAYVYPHYYPPQVPIYTGNVNPQGSSNNGHVPQPPYNVPHHPPPNWQYGMPNAATGFYPGSWYGFPQYGQPPYFPQGGPQPQNQNENRKNKNK